MYLVEVDKTTYHDNGWTVSHPFVLARKAA
jgi:hypothetical protein